MLESKDIENILNRVLSNIGNGDSDSSRPIMIFGDVTINIHCDDYEDDDEYDDCDDDSSETSHVSYNCTTYSDAESEAERKAWQRFYRANTYTG